MAFPKGLIELSEGLFQLGVKEVVLCPGSRNAPLILAFNRNKNFKTYSIVDERSAAYFGLGIAKKSNRPVVICCTSGTAPLNFAPAIAEAFHSNIPLIVLTADRPKEWLGQWDNQMINQTNLYQNYIHYFQEYPTEETSTKKKEINWYRNRIINESFAHSFIYQKGPVHLNIPISEPFYPEKNEILKSDFLFKKIQIQKIQAILPTAIKTRLEESLLNNGKVLISFGQLEKNKDLLPFIKEIQALGIPILAEPIANIGLGYSADLLVGKNSEKIPEMPNLVIHLGESVISKNHKKFLRNTKINEIWLVSKNKTSSIPDTFQGLNQILELSPQEFFNELIGSFRKLNLESSYYQSWKDAAILADNKLAEQFSNNPLEQSELNVWKHLFDYAKDQIIDIHFGNSMSARYPNLVGWRSINHCCFSNRGTSGIDGILSTAIGSSQLNETKINLCILGDLSFQYDKNALWNKYIGSNNRIIIINNQGGGIFRLLEGSARQEELEEFIEARQESSARLIAESYKINYRAISTIPNLRAELPKFLDIKMPGPRILEIFV